MAELWRQAHLCFCPSVRFCPHPCRVGWSRASRPLGSASSHVQCGSVSPHPWAWRHSGRRHPRGTFLTVEGACLPVARGLGQESEDRLRGAEARAPPPGVPSRWRTPTPHLLLGLPAP